MKNRGKIIIIAILVTILLIGLLGVVYAFFGYHKTSSSNKQLVTGDIYMSYTEDTALVITNAMPTSTYDSNNYFEFYITGKNTNTLYDIIYDIIINRGDVPTGKQESNRIDDRFIKFRLVERVNNADEVIFTNRSYIDLTSGERIHVATIPKNTNSEITHTYRLYMWIGDEVVIGNIENPEINYDIDTWNNIFASIKVSVNGDFDDKALDHTLTEKFRSEMANNVSYIKSYNTEVIGSNPTYTTRDTVETNSNKQDVLYFTGNDASSHGNVLFAGFCWQIVRTTDNGGVKLIYNGVAENNQCKTNRSAGKGVNSSQTYVTTRKTNISSETVFGKSYDYNLSTNTFTITEVLSGKSWSNNSSELIGTYSCLNGTSSCTTLYYIGHKQSETEASVAAYTIGNVSAYSQMGTSYYNAYNDAASLAGYMYNKTYLYQGGTATTPTGTFANDVSWSGSRYVLSNDTTNSLNSTHHYLCDDANCNKVRYYYIIWNSNSTDYYFYILLENGKRIEDALKEMINYKTNPSDEDGNANVYSSAIKGYLDNWYKKNLAGTNYEKYLDMTVVYCNDQSVEDLGGWDRNGASMSNLNGILKFKQYSYYNNLNCSNETEKMSTKNLKAKLDYPISLISISESILMDTGYRSAGDNYWTISPMSFYNSIADVRAISSAGVIGYGNSLYSLGVRGVITLKPEVMVTSGDGGYETPYVIGPLASGS